LLIVVVAAAAMWFVARGVAWPIRRMTEVMHSLAGGNKSVEVPSQDNKDEIGQMAKAVVVFKDNMIEAERLRADQEEQKKRAEADRRQAMLDLANKFEANVGGVINKVASAAEGLQATAESMATTAQETSRQSTAAASASEETSTSVHTVSSATEELSSSIKDITQKVEESSRVVTESAHQATETNQRVQRLKEAVAKIDVVVNLINDIAGQTNLLALNATIEAARAGEAGKGFAVVASEVKALATQTAKATDEIAGQIRSIQDETDQSVQAIEAITQTINKVNTISTSIATAVEQQGSATEEIARSAAQAAQGTTEMSSNIVSVSDAAKQTGNAASEMLSAAKGLSADGEALKMQVASFLKEVRAA
jgi:methyl-accepting chemotaxis protein